MRECKIVRTYVDENGTLNAVVQIINSLKYIKQTLTVYPIDYEEE